MYLGQETWGTGGQQKQLAQNGVHARTVPPRQVPQIPSRITVTGCVHDVVGPFVRGAYAVAGQNHGRPTYKRDSQVNGYAVQIYYWDTRDGAGNAGWWFGPEVGGSQVWAHQPDSAAPSPPRNGWKVPYNADVDSTMVVEGQNFSPQRQGSQPPRPGQKQQLQQIYMDEKRKSAEENRKKTQGEQQIRMEEQRATVAIRKVIQKLQHISQDKLEEARKELDTILAAELEKCGPQKEKVKAEGAACVEKTAERLKRVAEQTAKQEEDRKRAATLLADFAERVTTAKASLAKQKEATSGLLADDAEFTSQEELDAAADGAQEAGAGARQKLKVCSEFLSEKGSAMRNSVPPRKPVGQAGESKEDGSSEALPAEEGPNLAKLTSTMQDIAREVDVLLARTTAARSSAQKKMEAQSKLKQAKATFKKYDSDKDGFLNQKEVIRFAKGEYGFDLKQPTIATILTALGEKGVSVDNLQRLKVFVGVAREMARDGARRESRQAREKELDSLRAALRNKVEEAAALIGAAGQVVQDLESKAAVFNKEKTTTNAAELLREVGKAEDQLEKECGAAKTQESIAGLAEGVAAELKAFCDAEVVKLKAKMRVLEQRTNKVAAAMAKLREDATRRCDQELEALRQRAVAALRKRHRETRGSLDDFFKEIDADKDGAVSEADFCGAIKTCAGVASSDDAASNSPELFTREDLVRIFAYMDEEGKGKISKDAFLAHVRSFMCCVKPTLLTDILNVKDGKPLRRVEEHEIVEVLEGPMKDQSTLNEVDKSSLTRVRARSMQDETVGWITVQGNQGTVYLKEGGSVFQVVDETILTDDFDIGEPSSKVKETTRKLKKGELVEVREWPKKHAESGLTRMKCRVKPSGPVGWATTIGNKGGVFLKSVT